MGHLQQINSLKLANELWRVQFVTSELSPVQWSNVRPVVERSQHCSDDCKDQLTVAEAGCQDGRTQWRWMMLTIWRVCVKQ